MSYFVFNPLTGQLDLVNSSGSGGVTGPASSTDKAIVRWNGTAGTIIQDYTSNPPTITDTGQMFVGPPVTLTSQGTAFNTNTTDLNSNVIINSFQASGTANAAANVQALQFTVTDTGSNNISTLTGVNGLAIKSGSGSVTTLIGIQASARIVGTVTVTQMTGFNAQMRIQTGTSATTVTAFNVAASTMTGTATNQYGVKIAAMKVSGVTTGYGIASDGTTDLNYVMGTFGIGIVAPTEALHVNNGNLLLGTAGNKIKITTGSNASAGTGTLSGGTATISTTAVTANSLIFLTDTASSITNVGSLTVSSKSAGTSFTVTSTLALDTSTFNWLIIN